MNSADIITVIVLVTLIIMTGIVWIATMIYFHKKNLVILEALKTGSNPILIRNTFRDGGDYEAVVSLLTSDKNRDK